MDEFKVYSRLSYKYRLLYCLILNYYRGYYADNKLKSKVLVLCTTKKELTESLTEAIEKLSDKERTVISLYYFNSSLSCTGFIPNRKQIPLIIIGFFIW